MLDDCRSVFDMAARRDVVDPKADEIAAAQLTVDCKVEQREIALTILDLKSDPNGPDLFRPKRTLLANQTSFVPGGTGSNLSFLIAVDMVVLHVRPLPPQRPQSASRPSYRNCTRLEAHR